MNTVVVGNVFRQLLFWQIRKQ